MATVAQQSLDPKWAGKGPQGQNLIAWEDPVTKKRISGNDRGDSRYSVPIWGPAPPRPSSSGGGGEERISVAAPEDLPIYPMIQTEIRRLLKGTLFDPQKFAVEGNLAVEDVRLDAQKARRQQAQNMLGSGSYGISGALVDRFKETGEAASTDIKSRLDQLFADERDFLSKKRETGLRAAQEVFNVTVRGQTAQRIAEANRLFQADLLRQQTEFAAQQSALDIALQRAALAATSSGGSNTFGNINSFLQGLGAFV